MNCDESWKTAYDGYNGGKVRMCLYHLFLKVCSDSHIIQDDRPVDWAAEAPGNERPFNQAVSDVSSPYTGPSLMVMKFNVDVSSRGYKRNWPSPIQFHDKLDSEPVKHGIDPESMYAVADSSWRVFNHPDYREQYRAYLNRMPDFSYYHQTRKLPGYSSVDAETTQNALAFAGSMRIVKPGVGLMQEVHGSGHHSADYIGVSAIRAGKGTRPTMVAPAPMRLV